MSLLELRGKIFGRLSVVERVENKIQKNGKHRSQWLCLCECGKELKVTGHALAGGHTKSCGCLRRDKFYGMISRHGMSDTLEYDTWSRMVRRCETPTEREAPYYNGIEIGPELRTFEGFYKELGPRPPDKPTLDRIDNSKGYVTGNVRWATWGEQQRNKSNNVNITLNGVTRCSEDWGLFLGIKGATIRARLRRGKSIEEALRPTASLPPSHQTPSDRS